MRCQGNDDEGKVCRVCILAVGFCCCTGFTAAADKFLRNKIASYSGSLSIQEKKSSTKSRGEVELYREKDKTT